LIIKDLWTGRQPCKFPSEFLCIYSVLTLGYTDILSSDFASTCSIKKLKPISGSGWNHLIFTYLQDKHITRLFPMYIYTIDVLWWKLLYFQILHKIRFSVWFLGTDRHMNTVLFYHIHVYPTYKAFLLSIINPCRQLGLKII